jgi:signal transduction histidine kinase/response regulator of citrate/malate metabolism
MADKILLIDSDKSHSKALKVYLKRQQFKVFIANTSDEALLFLDKLCPDIIIADPGLPDTKILSLLKQIKLSTPGIQTIITTAEVNIDQAMDKFRSDVIGYLAKPLKSHALDLVLSQARNWIDLNQKLDHYTTKLEDLENAQSLYKQLFDEVPCYISVQDRQFRLTATNRMFKKDFGDEIGSHCYEVYKHRTSRCQNCPVASTFDDGLSHQTEEIVTSKSGKQINTLTWTAPIRNSTGDIAQVIEMSTNITQVRQLQDHLTSLGLMLGSMSHGVKGMLTAMDGGIYQLETGMAKHDKERTKHAFDQIKQMAGRIRKMVLEILYYAKSRKLNYETVDINEMTKKVIESAEAISNKNGIKLEVDITPDLGTVEVDPSWMQSALLNFLENAIDACTYDRSKSDHCVSIKVFESKPDRICYIITDNGMGMDQETKEKMFTLFFTSKGSQGTGLGMFIANHVILHHGGNIKVESELRKGSRFQICLPRQQPENSRTVDFPKEG